MCSGTLMDGMIPFLLVLTIFQTFFPSFKGFNRPEPNMREHSNLGSQRSVVRIVHSIVEGLPGPYFRYTLNYLLKAWLVMLTIWLTRAESSFHKCSFLLDTVEENLSISIIPVSAS